MEHDKSEVLKALCAAAKIARDAKASEEEILEAVKKRDENLAVKCAAAFKLALSFA
jgi:hypothetical protein